MLAYTLRCLIFSRIYIPLHHQNYNNTDYDYHNIER
jgi:hypothetical protein